VTLSGNLGGAYTVAKNGTGTYDITFDEITGTLLSADISLQLATTADQYVVTNTWTSSTKILKVKIWDKSGAAVTDVGVNANNRINFICVFDNT
jgi:hypothetical protein